MIIVRVELHSAITGQVTEIGRMKICNIGGTNELGDYSVETLRGRRGRVLNAGIVQRAAKVTGHPRLSQHVWNLAAKALFAMGYGK